MHHEDKDTTLMRGHVRILARYADGSHKTLVDRPNQIVNGYLSAISTLISQRPGDISPEQYAVNSLWVETSDTALVHSVSATDEEPEGFVVKRYVFDRDSDVDVNVGGIPGHVEFRAELTRSEGNGTTVRAVGLYSQGNDAANPDTADNVLLLARQLVGAIPKNSEFALEFTWRVQTTID